VRPPVNLPSAPSREAAPPSANRSAIDSASDRYPHGPTLAYASALQPSKSKTLTPRLRLLCVAPSSSPAPPLPNQIAPIPVAATPPHHLQLRAGNDRLLCSPLLSPFTTAIRITARITTTATPLSAVATTESQAGIPLSDQGYIDFMPVSISCLEDAI
jgi:hypothetical protein